MVRAHRGAQRMYMGVENQKIENSLNLALEATELEREQSVNLNVGYNKREATWEVIVKYSGERSDLELALKDITMDVVWLLNEYAIITATRETIQWLAKLPQLEYIEKPKRLFFERSIGQVASCFAQINREGKTETGKGVIVGILDSGIDFRNKEFQNMDGSSRILALWDQTISGNPPNGYLAGTEYLQLQLDEELLNKGVEMRVPRVGISGHGTQVASVAVGTSGVAPEADIIVVKLGMPTKVGFPRTTELIQGLDYVVRKALEYGKPIAVNISIGNNYGAHDGSSLIERYIDDIANYWKVSICVGAGNEANAAGHTAGRIQESQVQEIEFVVDRREVAFDLQIWKKYEDVVEIYIVAPNSERIGPLNIHVGSQRFMVGETEILIYYGEPSPYNLLQEIYLEFIPIATFIDTGIWKIEIEPIRIVTGEYDMWLPSYGALNIGTQFLDPKKENTVTIPSTAQRVITVGAYDAKTRTYADFSGRGAFNNVRYVKPDLVAPGVGVQVSSVNSVIKEVSGTSFATPFVAGSCAILMEWGIVNQNDIYLYGEKMKAVLRKNAKPILGNLEYPNNKSGYGALCVDIEGME